ncbi:hypothetical protein [Mucilaginibacter sp. dw_454]|uniref:hypothetical protein n=1 Tax=Mucilaginibacter sp. dw_454 TaxID=2720079 RepID=UPI001BD5A56C|nr:hypothetical protein [Mucilaginibacter sp. dw_454]
MRRENKILIIAGMHRSGTSLITHWLYNCGLNVGEDLAGAGAGNIEGHYEDLDFLRLHEDVLQANNLSKEGYVDQPAVEMPSYYKTKLQKLIEFKNEVSEQWGWKEPRTCLFLDEYRELIPGAYYLIIVRAFGASVNSLIQREFKNMELKYLKRKWPARWVWNHIRRPKRLKAYYQLHAEDFLNTWIAYNEAIINTIKTLPKNRFIVTDSNLLCTAENSVFSHLIDDWHFDLKFYDFNKVYKSQLLSRETDIIPFVKNKAVIDKAQKLEAKLRGYMVV